MMSVVLNVESREASVSEGKLLAMSVSPVDVFLVTHGVFTT